MLAAMTRLRRLLVLAVCVLAAGGAARAGDNGPFQPDDAWPFWSADARQVAFFRVAPAPGGRALAATWIVAAGRGPDRLLATGTPRGWRPNRSELLVQLANGTNTDIDDATGKRIGGFQGISASWSPDGTRIAFVRFGGTLYVADSAGENERAVASGVAVEGFDLTGPAWSPDGTRLAFTTVSGNGQTGIEVAAADGSGTRVVFSGANQNVNPSWSNDGRTIAFESNADSFWHVWLVGADGSDPHLLDDREWNDRFPQWNPEPGTARRLIFISDRQHVPKPRAVRGPSYPWAYALYQAPAADLDAPVKLADDVKPDSPARWSPTNAQIAFSAGRECLRFGIYVMRPDAPRTTQARRSNRCRFDGTPRADRLVGTRYLDIIRGFAGNDRIAAGDGPNVVLGGSGDDAITSGRGNDRIVGGPGRDTIHSGLGRDLVNARDGARDTVDCGGGRHDRVEVDRLDVVHNCEVVARP